MGHGFVESDTGAGPTLDSRRFSLLPRELPDLVRRMIDSPVTARYNPLQQQPLLQAYPMMPGAQSGVYPAAGLMVKKRQQLDEEGDETRSVEKRSATTSDESEELDNQRERKEEPNDVDNGNTFASSNDADLNESLRSLQKRRASSNDVEADENQQVSVRSVEESRESSDPSSSID